MEDATCHARIVLLTHPEKDAEVFARRLVEARLAACVSLHAVRSIYRWEGQIEVAGELQLVLKTGREQLPALEVFLAREHPYQVPEFVVLKSEYVEPKYAAWLGSVL